jgi:5'-deoxynucleotidase YfbR-like HD superfamily hydrolase
LHLISLLPSELQESFAPYLDSEKFSPEEKHLVKQADLICAYIKAQLNFARAFIAKMVGKWDKMYGYMWSQNRLF